MRFAKIFITMLAMTVFILSTTATTTFAADDDGGYVEAKGWGMGPKNRNPKSSFYKLYARQAARLDALRKIYEMLVDVQIDRDTSVNSVMSDIVIEKMIIKEIATKQVEKPNFYMDSNNQLICEEVLRVSIWKGINSINNDNSKEIFPKPNFPQPTNKNKK